MSIPHWQHNLDEPKILATHGISEVSPFIWRGRLCRLQNFKASERKTPGSNVELDFHGDGCELFDNATCEVFAHPWANHYFAIPVVDPATQQLAILGGDYEWNRPWWNIRQIHLTQCLSDDATHWSPPQIVLTSLPDEEKLYNLSIIREPHRWLLLYQFLYLPSHAPDIRFAESTDLMNWKRLPTECHYGQDKYVGGPAFYAANGYYYLLYVNARDPGKAWDTRITRSRDLVRWQDAPADRPVLSPDFQHVIAPDIGLNTRETSASDAELLEWNGRTCVWWNASDQQTVGDLETASSQLPLPEFLDSFFR